MAQDVRAAHGTRYVIRDTAGMAQATHVRTDGTDGKSQRPPFAPVANIADDSARPPTRRTARRTPITPAGDGVLVLLARWLAEVSADAASTTGEIPSARAKGPSHAVPRWARREKASESDGLAG